MGIFIVCLIVGLFVYFKFIKPYFVKYDNAILFTGGIGSGKSLNSVKVALQCYGRNKRKVWFLNKKNKIKKFILKLFKKDFTKYDIEIADPILISNMPIKRGGKIISNVLTKEVICLKERIPQYSVVLIDEISSIVNQFNWNIEEVQYHLNEFIMFFRHYIGGHLILNAQAESEVVKQIRVKLNSYYICMNFKKFLCFYKVDLLHRLCTGGEEVNTSNFIDEDIKRKYGILSKNYDSRYLSERYKNVDQQYNLSNIHKEMKVNKLMRFKEYKSRCDNK